MNEWLVKLMIEEGLTPSSKSKKPTVPPKCSVPGCNESAVQILGKSDPRYPLYRRSSWIKKKYPNATDTWCCSHHHRQHLATSNGYNSFTDFENSRHPYLRYRKTYCENVDARLGFTCTTNIFWQGMLQVDHIDGNHTNNDETNLQTLCACCHTYKSWKNEDYKTPGRKTRSQV